MLTFIYSCSPVIKNFKKENTDKGFVLFLLYRKYIQTIYSYSFRLLSTNAITVFSVISECDIL